MTLSPIGKATIVGLVLLLAALLAIRAPAHRKRGFYTFSAGLAAVALLIAFRATTWSPPPPTSIVGDADAFIADHREYIARFERWAEGKTLCRSSPQELLDDLWVYRDEIMGKQFKELYPAVLAAYGDTYVRSRPGARWLKIRQQLAVGVPKKPWTYQPLEIEVYNYLDRDV